MQLRGKVLNSSVAQFVPPKSVALTPQEVPLEAIPEAQVFEIAAEEREWIRRIRAGDIAAFDMLMTRYRGRALRLASHVMQSDEEAEDVVQEAFLRIYAQIREFREIGRAHV